MIKEKSILLFLLLALFPPFSGCGYTTRAANIPFKTLYVEEFDNSIIYTAEGERTTYLPLLEVDVRNAVVDRFQLDGNVRINKTSQAEAVLSGKLLNFVRDGLRYDGNDDIEEYRIRIIVSLELRSTLTNEVIWKEPRFSGEASYFVTGPNAVSEETAVKEAITDLSRRVVERTVENW